MNDSTDRPHETEANQTPFEKFESLTKALLAVPKKELDARLAEEKAKKQQAKAAKG